MKRLWGRTPPAPADVVARAGLARGEKVLAGARSEDGTWVLGTRDALLLLAEGAAAPTRIAWEQVQAADWSRDDDRLRVSEVGEYGRPRPVHEVVLTDPGLLLQLVRERVTASVVLQRRVEVTDGRGLTVVGRRPPRGGDVAWAYELDAGLDPGDPAVRAAAEAGLRSAAEELGLS
ncbi:MAG TPA: hypothetical protein VFV40_05950 [Nocardioides sp.]|nr:hypothetical protein [Nocardioides sp.]